jgi:prolipoprotein diacylglyceryltransferase
MFPIILETKYFTIHSLWLFIAIALIVGTLVFIKIGTKNGLKLQFLTENALILLVLSIIGARVFAILFSWNMFFYKYSLETFLQIFKIWDKGLSLWGAIFVGTITLYHLCKKNDQSLLKWLDSIVPAFLIAIAIACVGAFLDGSWYGNETTLPWGVNFESPAIKYTVPIHPTQIYILLFSTLIAVSAILLKDHKFFEPNGKSATLSIGLFSLFNFLNEFLRGDDVTMIFGVRLSQATYAAIFIFSLIFYFIYYNKRAENLKNKLFGLRNKQF